mmetsp:Transcript_12205/g.30633  ORF Transcript_12205/g.30633 Transcript_12205/m.30633 type:complete len:88 (+) Transcript_12205:78-341(+)
MVKCNMTRGLMLHLDAPVKQFVLDLNSKHNHSIVVFDLIADQNKVFVNETFEDNQGQEQDTVTWLQGKLDGHLESITWKPEGAKGGR